MRPTDTRFMSIMFPLGPGESVSSTYSSRVKRLQETEKTLQEVKVSTEKIKRETQYIRETGTRPPATPEFLKRLNILY